jgi:hypothetical protein
MAAGALDKTIDTKNQHQSQGDVDVIGGLLNVISGGKLQCDAGSLIGFNGQSPATTPVLATGASHTVDDVITALQTLGLFKQS